jgi:hypothetical protein
MSTPTVARILRDHVRLSITSFDRLYLGGYVPTLQSYVRRGQPGAAAAHAQNTTLRAQTIVLVDSQGRDRTASDCQRPP